MIKSLYTLLLISLPTFSTELNMAMRPEFYPLGTDQSKAIEMTHQKILSEIRVIPYLQVSSWRDSVHTNIPHPETKELTMRVLSYAYFLDSKEKDEDWFITMERVSSLCITDPLPAEEKCWNDADGIALEEATFACAGKGIPLSVEHIRLPDGKFSNGTPYRAFLSKMRFKCVKSAY